jgi:DNA polymerase III subunit delta'
MEPFASVPEQSEAKRLLTAALDGGGAHAFLLHGPPGVGKRTAAFALAAALLGDERRVEQRSHPDLYLLQPLGEMIRIDDIRALRHDLHMRPFEAGRRVYLVLDADRMNEDAADALLKDLEEPPPYAVIVLVAAELGPLPPTILSRCQLVQFRRLSEGAVREWIAAQAPDRSADEVRVLARASGGRLDRARRLLDPDAAA